MNSQWSNTTTSACCFILNFSAGFLGLGRSTAFAVRAFRLKVSVVLGSAPRGRPPAFPPKTNGGGIFLFRQSDRERLRPYYALPDRASTLSLGIETNQVTTPRG